MIWPEAGSEQHCWCSSTKGPLDYWCDRHVCCPVSVSLHELCNWNVFPFSFFVHLVMLHPYPLISLHSIPQNDKVKVFKEKHFKRTVRSILQRNWKTKTKILYCCNILPQQHIGPHHSEHKRRLKQAEPFDQTEQSWGKFFLRDTAKNLMITQTGLQRSCEQMEVLHQSE